MLLCIIGFILYDLKKSVQFIVAYPELKLNYDAVELVSTENMDEETWLDYRRKGIGGSDAAAVLGVSPYKTARDVYFEKLGRKKEQ